MTLTKNWSSSPKDRNNPEWGYLSMQQQLELMNTRFIEVMSGETDLRTKVASLWDRLDPKGLKGRRFAKWSNSPLEESISEYTNEKAKDFDDNHSGGFWPHRNQRLRGVQPLEQFGHMRVDKDDGF